MCGHTAEDEGGQKGQGDDEGVEEAIVAFPHTVPHPGAVVIEALWERRAVVEEGAGGRVV